MCNKPFTELRQNAPDKFGELSWNPYVLADGLYTLHNTGWLCCWAAWAVSGNIKTCDSVVTKRPQGLEIHVHESLCAATTQNYQMRWLCGLKVCVLSVRMKL